MGKQAAPAELILVIQAVCRGGTFLSPSISGKVVEEYIRRAEAVVSSEDSYNRLTPREREVLQLIAEGRTSPEIAEVYNSLRDWAYSGDFTTTGWQPTLQLQARTVVYRLEHRDPELLAHIVKQADWLCENDLDEWSWAWIARSLAFVYDWCYEDLAKEQRRRYGRRAMECAKTVYSLWQHPPVQGSAIVEYQVPIPDQVSNLRDGQAGSVHLKRYAAISLGSLGQQGRDASTSIRRVSSATLRLDGRVLLWRRQPSTRERPSFSSPALHISPAPSVQSA